MISRPIVIVGTALALAVAGCGKDKDDPAPTPTPTPTPTSTSSPITYSTLPLTAVTEVFTVSSALSYTGDAAAGPVTLGAAGTDSFSNRVRLTLQNTVTSATTGDEVVRQNAEESRFTGADLATAPAPAVTEYVFRETTPPTTAGQFTQLELLNNTITGQVTTDALLGTLTRSSYAAWTRGDSTAGEKRVTYGAFGYPTALSDMPTTGSVSYAMKVAGRVVISPAAGASTVAKLAGTIITSINYASGLVSLTLNLTREDGTAYGTFVGTGTIPVGNNQFTGSFGPGSAAGASGTFQGIAYGPQAAELGISFAITGTNSRAVGVLVGKKS